MSPCSRSLHQLVCAGLTFFATLGSAVAEVRHLGVLPLSVSPLNTLFQGQDGYLYGAVGGEDVPESGPPTRSGMIYQLSPTGGIRYLHRFPWLQDSSVVNSEGAEPSELLAMGNDGYLYGTTRRGGAHACGVFYRLGTDGSFQVLADLPLDTLDGLNFGKAVIGADGAFYALCNGYPIQDPDNRVTLLRIGLDGTIQPLYRAPDHRQQLLVLEPSNPDHSEVRISWVELYQRSGRWGGPEFGRKGIGHVVTLSLPGGDVLSSREVAFLAGLPEESDPYPDGDVWRYATFFSSRPGADLFCADWNADSVSYLCRILSVDATGRVSVLAQYGPGASDPVPKPRSFLMNAEGDLYLTSGSTFGVPRKTIPGALLHGEQINLLTPGGPSSYESIVDLDGYPLGAWCATPEGHIYGVSWGATAEEVEGEEAGGLVGMKVLRAADTTKRTVRKPPGAFRRSNPADPNLPPMARLDRFTLPARSTVTTLHVPVLRNDLDPEKGVLTLSAVGLPVHGAAVIVAGTAGQPARVVYTPADWPRHSDSFTYTVTDSGGKTAVGRVDVRANLRSSFKGKDLGEATAANITVSLNSLALEVRPTGKFAGSLNLNGKSVSLAGEFDYADSIRLSRRVRNSDDLVTVRLSLTNVGNQRQLNYEVIYLGQTLNGEMVAK